MRLLLPLLLLAAFPVPAIAAAALEYTCRTDKTFGPITSATGAAVRADEKAKSKAPERYVYDAASEQAAASDVHGQLAPALALKIGGGLKFITAGAVTTISNAREFHRVETVTVDGKLSTSIGIGLCEVKENRLAGKPFSDR
jgi:hypothetical protein